MKNTWRARALVAGTGLAVAAIVLAGCAGGGDSADSAAPASDSAIIVTNGSEPENPLIPTNTNEVGGGKILDVMFAGLASYEADGSAVNDMAEEITVVDAQNLTVTLKKGQTFTDGEEVTADNFIKAWNYGAKFSNKQLNAYFFEDIEGYNGEADSELTGLEQVDDYTFNIKLNKPASDFAQRLGYSAFYPLPDVAFEDMEAFGANPIGNGPYKLAGESAWQHDVQIDLVKNEDYQGVREVKNGGLTIKFYATDDAAYADLQAGEADVIDRIPASSLASFESDLGDRAVNQSAAVIQAVTIPDRLAHFAGEEGKLRRAALSLAIDRAQITETIFQGSRTPATDFTSPVLPTFTGEVEGNDVLTFDPERAKELWAQADEISPWEGSFQIGYNSDSDHGVWVDAVSNSLKNNLGIDASGAAVPTFAAFRESINNDSISTAFRSGWQADYPGIYNFLGPQYATGGGSNDGDYSSAEYDALLAEGIGSTDEAAAAEAFDKAQTVLLSDLPALPLWYQNVTGGFSENVQNVEFGWNSVPLFHEITKSE